VTAAPQNGTFEVKFAYDYPNFPASNVRSACNARAIAATQLWYTPKEAYSGSDRLSVLVIFPSGTTRNVSFQISVIP
jgi:hypothetical protein